MSVITKQFHFWSIKQKLFLFRIPRYTASPRIMIISIIIIKMDVGSLLVSLLVLCSPLTKVCDGVIPSATEKYLCGDEPQREGTKLKLATNVTHYINPGNFCVVQNLVNVTISSDIPGRQARSCVTIPRTSYSLQCEDLVF